VKPALFKAVGNTCSIQKIKVQGTKNASGKLVYSGKNFTLPTLFRWTSNVKLHKLIDKV